MRTFGAALSLLVLTSCAALPGGPPAFQATAARGAPREVPETPQPTEARIEVAEPSSLLDAPAANRCPPEMVLVADRVCVDRYEASLVEVDDDGATHDHSPHHPPSEEAAVRATAGKGYVPQAHISGNEAQRACEAAGKRLCTRDEWVAACRGPARTTFPYGQARREGVCNDDGRDRHPVADVTQRYGLDPDRMWYENMHHPQINQLPDTVERGGEHAACRSGYGTYDMVGNLHEWIDDPEGTFRGGFFMDTRINGEGCNYATTAHGMDYRDYSTGFRCCRDPEPVE